MTNVMMALGEFRFELSTAAYQSLERQTNYHWASSDRLGTNPAKQFTGYDETINLSGVIFPAFKSGIEQLNKMRAMAGRGEALLLVDGRGEVHGYWVVNSIAETGNYFLSNGVSRKQEFRLELGFYGFDRPAGQS